MRYIPQRMKCCVWLLLAVVLAPVASHADASAPNVLLVAVDTLRRDHCSLYGYARDTTPNLRRLAAEGAVFDAAYAPMSVTGPSIATLLTGRYPASHGLVRNGLRLEPAEVTLAEVLGERGYATGAVVSSFALDRRFGFEQGFTEYDDRFDPAEASVSQVETWEGVQVDGAFDRRAAATSDRAIRWLRQAAEQERPFFLFLHYFDPHSPYRPPAELDGHFPADPGADAVGEAIRRYDTEIAYVDRELGRVVGAIDELGLASRTLVVVTADHGEGLNERGYFFHGAFVYEEEMRVPLVVRWPGRVPAGRVLAAPVELGDLAPTVLELTGAPGGSETQGTSLADALLGQGSLDPSRAVFLHRRPFPSALIGGSIRVSGEKFGIRQGQWKYIDGPAERTRELFDLERDPGERRNLVDAEPVEARRLAERLASWRRAQAARKGAVPEVSPEDRRGLRALGYEH